MLMKIFSYHKIACRIVFRLYLCEKLIASDSSIIFLWSHLSSCHRYVLFLELFSYGNA